MENNQKKLAVKFRANSACFAALSPLVSFVTAPSRICWSSAAGDTGTTLNPSSAQKDVFKRFYNARAHEGPRRYLISMLAFDFIFFLFLTSIVGFVLAAG